MTSEGSSDVRAGPRNEDRDVGAGIGASPGDYDILPYPSLPHAYTQPAQLAAIASLFGLTAPRADRARVLELGCASGGNIIPLAARFPHTHVLGVDLSERHVDEGRRRIASLGLANAELRQGDLTEIELPRGQLDYVLCHGVFSWVPRVAQDAILRICRDALAADGIAVISYNVLPGWHLRRIVRDICMHHVGTEGPPQQRVAKARALLEQIAESASETELYGQLLRNEAKRIAQRPGAYILGELLAADNTPCYFHEFVARASQYGLRYLCEGDLNASVPEMQNKETRARNRAMGGPSPLDLEQSIDFITGRPFRRSILIKAEQATGIRRSRSLERLRELHFASPLRVGTSRGSTSGPVYKDDRGRVISARTAATRQALATLAAAYPGTVTLEQLTAASAPNQGRAAADTQVRSLLFSVVVAAQATASVLPLKVGRATVEMPRAWWLARVEAASGQPWVTSLNHLPVALPPLAALLFPHLDGSKDRQNLRALLTEAVMRENVAGQEFKAGNTPPHSIVTQHVDSTLAYLARNALLE